MPKEVKKNLVEKFKLGFWGCSLQKPPRGTQAVSYSSISILSFSHRMVSAGHRAILLRSMSGSIVYHFWVLPLQTLGRCLPGIFFPPGGWNAGIVLAGSFDLAEKGSTPGEAELTGQEEPASWMS